MTASLRSSTLGLVLGAALFALASSGGEAAPIDGHFSLEALDGHSVSDTDYHGKILLIYFGYTFCPDVCPTMLSQIGAALQALGPKAAQFQPVFITLDPARDKTPVMQDYLKAFDPRIIGLRGDPDDIEAAAKSFHAYYRARSLGNGQYTVDHSSYLYVMDRQGKFLELLGGDVPGHPLVDALRKLVK